MTEAYLSRRGMPYRRPTSVSSFVTRRTRDRWQEDEGADPLDPRCSVDGDDEEIRSDYFGKEQ